MKKLNLKLSGLQEMLTKEQMKKVTGGYDCMSWKLCNDTCVFDRQVECSQNPNGCSTNWFDWCESNSGCGPRPYECSWY